MSRLHRMVRHEDLTLAAQLAKLLLAGLGVFYALMVTDAILLAVYG